MIRARVVRTLVKLVSYFSYASVAAVVVAFGDIFSEGGRIVGLLIMYTEVRRRVGSHWEHYALLTGMLISGGASNFS